MLGQVIHGYRVDRSLSVDKGGMGDVFFATHVESGAEAVVKVLKPEMSAHRDIVTRFFNEARAAASIHHPGIVQIHNVGYHGDRAYLLMEKLRGDDLENRIKAGPLPLDRAILFMRQAAGAIAAAHERGIVHRDLKPANLFVVRDPDVMGGERVKVLDFGIAKLSLDTGGNKTQGVFGTPAYMSPEQCASAGEVDARSDLYALGCIFYELVCGRPPFGHGGIELIASHLRDTPPPPHALAPWVPPAVEAVILQLLEKNPAQRFASCGAFIGALDGVAATLPPGATPSLPPQLGYAPPSPSSPPQPSHGHPSTLSGAAGVMGTAQPTTPGPRRGNRGVMIGLIAVALAGVAVAVAVVATSGKNHAGNAAGGIAAAGGPDAAAAPEALATDAGVAAVAVDAGPGAQVTPPRRGDKPITSGNPTPPPPPRQAVDAGVAAVEPPPPPPPEEPAPPPPPADDRARATQANAEGKEAMFANRYADATAKFRRAIALDPQPKYYFNLGISLYQEGKCGEAVRAFDHVLGSGADATLKEKVRRSRERAAACAS